MAGSSARNAPPGGDGYCALPEVGHAIFAAAAAALALALDDHRLACGGFSCSSGATPGTGTDTGTGTDASDEALKPEEEDEDAAALAMATAGAVALEGRAAPATAKAFAARTDLASVANCMAASLAWAIHAAEFVCS